eukprot:CAMPEP_0118881918 /NCGR_PEP_ID=MMETSP1163-20130328/21298_1 /TAXON_ID=124430 /ORGANISM="Phaeomonas parva, Strain CCMP2877" /LENGTH=117 /DNA_ID=CAMNT_0006818833 /DNA_START=227 /DNA_END=581 /DNA_ORIENTATION=-
MPLTWLFLYDAPALGGPALLPSSSPALPLRGAPATATAPQRRDLQVQVLRIDAPRYAGPAGLGYAGLAAPWDSGTAARRRDGAIASGAPAPRLAGSATPLPPRTPSASSRCKGCSLI